MNSPKALSRRGRSLRQIIKYYYGTLVVVPAKMEKHFKGFSFSYSENWLRCVDGVDIDTIQ